MVASVQHLRLTHGCIANMHAVSPIVLQAVLSLELFSILLNKLKVLVSHEASNIPFNKLPT